ncbi:unnamed protein product [Heterobilharzia americana]|nr:unnamed protein product [Heterobilharzia americana]
MVLEDSVLDEQLAEMITFELGLDMTSLDSNFCPNSLTNPSPINFYLQYLGLYLIKSDLVSAKFLYKRMPSSMKENPSIKCLWSLGRLLWRNDVKSFFSSISLILSDPRQPDILVQMVKQIREKQLNSTISLVARAYSSVSVEFLRNKLGLLSEDIDEHFLSKGWEMSQDGRFISRSGDMIEEKDKISLENETVNSDLMSKLSEFMCFMENH